MSSASIVQGRIGSTVVGASVACDERTVLPTTESGRGPQRANQQACIGDGSLQQRPCGGRVFLQRTALTTDEVQRRNCKVPDEAREGRIARAEMQQGMAWPMRAAHVRADPG